MKTLFAMGAATLVGMAGWTANVMADGCGSACSATTKVAEKAGTCDKNAPAQAMNVAFQARGDIVDVAVGAGSFTTLVAAVQAAGLVDVLKGEGPFTVFAPSDEAFAKLPDGTVESLLLPENREMLRAVLTYHVVPGRVTAEQVVGMDFAPTANGQRLEVSTRGDAVMINQSRVIATDIAASNGVIHVVDTVMMPQTKNVLEVASEAGSFTTLAAAIEAAGLVDTLSGDGPFTVFAPTDEAFAKLPSETLESLLRPENRDQLVAILTFHVVPGRVYSDQALEAGQAETVQGQSVRIAERYGTPRVQNARIVATDVQASNGVIHVIDTVILPD
ncbi:MAG: fasciclin domain-containing protein [Phycisphaerales bacterium]|nr:MAG: fasciclin domain-containing protein [Phycisphaerales bacterium]